MYRSGVETDFLSLECGPSIRIGTQLRTE